MSAARRDQHEGMRHHEPRHPAEALLPAGPRIVNQCVCAGVPFACIATRVREGLSLEQIQDRTNCGNTCGLCRPYLGVVAATGLGALPVMSEGQCAAVVNAHHRDTEAPRAV